MECREYLPAATSAAVTLRFDGRPDALPRLVIRYDAQERDGGYLVENKILIDVPQKSGDDLTVPQNDPRLASQDSEQYERTGGTLDP